MGIISWLTGTHERDLARKAYHRVRNGYPLPGDITRAHRFYPDVGALLAGDPAIGHAERGKKGKR